jgi:hypothetical protein
MSGLLKAAVVIVGLLLATAAVVGLALAWAGRDATPSGQGDSGMPMSTVGPAATPVPMGPDTDTGLKTATFALG